MLKYIIHSLRRKKARRHTKKYPTTVDTFAISGYGNVLFANWENPLVERKVISSRNVNFFKKFLREGDLAIDIGGNIGHMTIPMALAVGRAGKILSFDPNPFVFEILQQNAGLNPLLTNIETFNFAITENEEEFYYNSSEASFNNGGISKDAESRHGRFALDQKIQGINLENFMRRNYINSIDKLKLIKIDTEGYDKEIIRSIPGILDKYHPVVITECFKKNDAEQRYEQFDLLAGHGYSMYYFSDFDENAEIIPIVKKEDMMRWKHFDLYAIHE